MSVFRNYNSRMAGGVNANAFPRVISQPWIPTQRNIRANPNIPSQPQRIQPNERGTFFPTSADSGGTLSPSMSGGCVGCGGSCGNGSQQMSVTPPTATELATRNVQPVVTKAGGATSSIHVTRPQNQPAFRTGSNAASANATYQNPPAPGRGVGALRRPVSQASSPIKSAGVRNSRMALALMGGRGTR